MKYYWLKLHSDFFEGKRIKKLRSIAGGDTYTIIYLKMLLATINTDGVFRYEGIEDSLAEEMALTLAEDAENVRITIVYLRRVGLLEDIGEGIELIEAAKNTGSESESAHRVRAHRERKALQCNTTVTDGNANETACNVEKERDKEKEKIKRESKHKHGSYNNVLLTDAELEKLKTEFPSDYQNRIERLSEYIASTGKSYKSHLATIRTWARRDGEKQKERQNKYTNFSQRDYDFAELEKELLKQ